MRVIFSRKGFDSAAGGSPSPIINGEPLSLPIPTKMPTPIRFGDLIGPHAGLVADLTRGKWTAESFCHLDPDINPATLSRMPGWRGSLGQVSRAQSHLANQCVQKGDLFVFWGLFRPVQKLDIWRFTAKKEHRIWGWLQIADIIDLGPDGSHVLQDKPWLKDHPHCRAGWSATNVLYVATDRLTIDSLPLSLPGYGVLKQGYRLTKKGATPSVWTVPNWLNPKKGGTGMTYHPLNRWSEDGTLKSAAKGQEFVANIGTSEIARQWIGSFLHEALT